MQSKAIKIYWNADARLFHQIRRKIVAFAEEKRLENLRKKALTEILAKGDRRLLIDAGIDPDETDSRPSQGEKNWW